MSGPEILQFTFSGLTLGGVYALIALSLTITYNGCGVVNFAQGEFVMVGGMTAATLVTAGVPLAVACLGALAAAVATSAALYGLTLAPLRRPSPTTMILITIGAGLVITSIAQYVFGTASKSLGPFIGADPFRVGGAVISTQAMLVIVVTIALMAALYVFFRRTTPGRQFMAASENREGALVVGIDVRAISWGAFLLAGLLGAVAGVLIIPVTSMTYGVGLPFTIAGVTAAVLGGFGNTAGAVIGGIALGLVQAYSAAVVSSGYQALVPFVALSIVLIVRPGGLLGSRALAH